MKYKMADLNFLFLIIFLLGFIVLPIIILIQVLLSVFILIKRIRIYQRYKKIVDKEILRNKNIGIFNFLILPEFRKLSYKSFSREKYEVTFKEIFRFNNIQNRSLKQELKNNIEISRIQTMLGIVLVILVIIFIAVFFIHLLIVK